MNDNTESPLAVLSPIEKPDCNELLSALRASLGRAAAIMLWTRMEQNHWARYCWWPGQDWSCRRVAVPGQPVPLPWKNAADLRIRTVDTVINEWGELLDIAERRVVPHVLPALLDAGDEENMQKAESWGAVMEYYGEVSEYDIQSAKAQWRSIGWEYGHSITYVGWNEERQMVPRTLDAESVAQLAAMLDVMERGGMTEEGMVDPQMMEDAAVRAEGLLLDKSNADQLVGTLRKIDPEMSEREARRIIPKLRTGKPVAYFVPVIVRATPELRALTPGLDIFYPPETTTIQKAQHITMPEWWSDVEMRANVTTRGWDGAAVEKIIAKAQAGRATFFQSVATGVVTGSQVGWLLTGGMVGMGIRDYDFSSEKEVRQWQLIRVFWKASDPVTGVPVLYQTIFHPDLPDDPVWHEAGVDDHAKYPFVEYKLEPGAPTLWSSRGVGELSISEQEELRFQANYCFDNAAISIRPPYEVNARSDVSVTGLSPGQRIITTSSGMNSGIKKVDVGGDARWSIEVQQMAQARVGNYFKCGPTTPELDPIAVNNARQSRVNWWVLCVKQATKMMFATIQQHAPKTLRATAINGRKVNLNVTREEIQGEMSLLMEFDVATLDPKAVEARAKMVGELIAPLDREGLLNTEPLMRLLMLSISPTWERQIVKPAGAASQDEQEKAMMNAMMALNGIEPKYLKGGNPLLRKQVTEAILNLPMLDEKGQPLVGEDGQPLPGRARQIVETNPDVMALFQNLIKHETFEAEQQENVDIGKIGVKPIQQEG